MSGEVWMMVLWMYSTNHSAAINTLPRQFASEAACEVSGKVLSEKSKGRINYACVPTPLVKMFDR